MNMFYLCCACANAAIQETTRTQVRMTWIICSTIVLLSLIVAGIILWWHIKDAKTKLSFEDKKRAWDKEDRENKIAAEIRSKQLSFLEEYVKKDSKLKELTKEQCQEFLSILDNLKVTNSGRHTDPNTDK